MRTTVANTASRTARKKPGIPNIERLHSVSVASLQTASNPSAA
jgi:hypothetical protein